MNGKSSIYNTIVSQHNTFSIENLDQKAKKISPAQVLMSLKTETGGGIFERPLLRQIGARLHLQLPRIPVIANQPLESVQPSKFSQK